MRVIWYLVIAGLWIVQIYLAVRCFRRGRWSWGLVGVILIPPAAWVGAFLPPVTGTPTELRSDELWEAAANSLSS